MLSNNHKSIITDRGESPATVTAKAPLAVAILPLWPIENESQAVHAAVSVLSVAERFSDLQRTRTEELRSGIAQIAMSPLIASTALTLGWACGVGLKYASQWGTSGNIWSGIIGGACLIVLGAGVVVSGGVGSVLSLVWGSAKISNALRTEPIHTTSQKLEDFGVSQENQDLLTSWKSLMHAFGSQRSPSGRDRIARVIAGTDLASQMTNPSDLLTAYSILARDLAKVDKGFNVTNLVYHELLKSLHRLADSSHDEPTPHSVAVLQDFLNEVTSECIPNIEAFASAVVTFSKWVEPGAAIDMLVKVRSLIGPDTLIGASAEEIIFGLLPEVPHTGQRFSVARSLAELPALSLDSKFVLATQIEKLLKTLSRTNQVVANQLIMDLMPDSAELDRRARSRVS